MVEILGLQSVILQTTAFRAIARMFWGFGESKGIKALEQLHRIDQETYYRQAWRRTPEVCRTKKEHRPGLGRLIMLTFHLVSIGEECVLSTLPPHSPEMAKSS